jgi:hypothetical protein
MIKEKAGTSKGLSGNPTTIILPFGLRSVRKGATECGAETVLIIPSMLNTAACK